jgi:2-phosphosulfolactate phosphatase
MRVSVAVHFLSAHVSPDDLAGCDVVVIDVLRASTTITHALAAGATCVIPCREVEDAMRTASGLPSGTAILGGERGGLPIEGFQLGNSPTEYTRDSVGGKTVVFTTTNGTLALMQCKQAARVFVGCFVNLSAVVGRPTGERPIHLLCAGTQGQVTREDVLCAGAMAERLLESAEEAATVNDEARIAVDTWRAAVPRGIGPANALTGELGRAMRQSEGGRNLLAIGMEHDIDSAADVDRFSIVPQLDVASWRIVPA